MRPALVNDRFGDPGVYVDFVFEKRAMLLDLGDVSALSPRQILKLTDIFVTHAHMDHFIGFDQVLRTVLGRDKHIRLYGPEGFIERVAHRLQGYSWNLLERYGSELSFLVTEVLSDKRARIAAFHISDRFQPTEAHEFDISDGVLYYDDVVAVRATILDHRIPCLGFAIKERTHINIMRNKLEELGLPVGPWLKELKHAVAREDPDETPIRAWWRDDDGVAEKTIPLGYLRENVLSTERGQKIVYLTDIRFSRENRTRVADLAFGADLLFIEAAFRQNDEELAAKRYHLTTTQAGILGRDAKARRIEPFHFSLRYADEENAILNEVEEAFSKETRRSALTP